MNPWRELDAFMLNAAHQFGDDLSGDNIGGDDFDEYCNCGDNPACPRCGGTGIYNRLQPRPTTDDPRGAPPGVMSGRLGGEGAPGARQAAKGEADEQ